MKKYALLATVGLSLLIGGCDRGDPRSMFGGRKETKVVETAYPENVYFGDTHLHTSNSSDAFAFGVRLGPEEALRFASGEEVTATMGIKAKLSRPLDFLVIADHSDGLAASQGDPRRAALHVAAIRCSGAGMTNCKKGPTESAQVARELIDRFSQRTLPAALMDPKAECRTHGGCLDRATPPSSNAITSPASSPPSWV